MSLRNRISKLEASKPPQGSGIRLIIRNLVSPDLSSRLGRVSLLGGGTFWPDDYPTFDALHEAVGEDYQSTFGEPMPADTLAEPAPTNPTQVS